MRKLDFTYAKIKTQISCAVIAQLISAFVFDRRAVQFVLYLFPKCQASSTGWFVSDLVGNTEDRFSHVAAHMLGYKSTCHGVT